MSTLTNSSSTPAYRVRSLWEGQLLNETTHEWEEDADAEFEERESYYFNLPNIDLAVGTTIQISRISDDVVTREITI